MGSSKASIPGVLVVLLVGMVILSLADIVTLAVGERNVMTIVGLAVRIGLIIGILKGSEGFRSLLIGVAVLSLFSSVVLFLRGAVVSGALGVAWSAFTVYCLTRRDVRSWMFERSFDTQMIDTGSSVCPKCGSTWKAGADYCTSCGMKQQ